MTIMHLAIFWLAGVAVFLECVYRAKVDDAMNDRPDTSAVSSDRVLELFRGGIDTRRIGQLLRMRESDVEKKLHLALDRERKNRNLAEEAGL